MTARESADRELPDEVRDKREEILQIAARRGAHNVRVFGSSVRGDAGPDSDVDFVVNLESGRSLLDLGGLQMDLQELLDRPVDVTTESSLREGLRERVLREAVSL